MLKNLSTVQIIFIIVLLPISWYCMTDIIAMVDFKNIILDIAFDMVMFFTIPYIFVRASIPIFVLVQAIVNILKK